MRGGNHVAHSYGMLGAVVEGVHGEPPVRKVSFGGRLRCSAVCLLRRIFEPLTIGCTSTSTVLTALTFFNFYKTVDVLA